jgi:peptidoglycan hydrolase-like protein with peptidoglycan-binding domain
MYDSVTARDIPGDATIVGGYVDTKFAWSPVDWDRFPTAAKIRIAISARTNEGNELDVEPGAASPDEAAAWVNMRIAAGLQKVSIYMNRSTWPRVQAVINNAGLQDWVVYRVAEWNRTAHSIPGAWAVQYQSPSTGAPGHYDLNVVDDLNWLHLPLTGLTVDRELLLASPNMTGEDVRFVQGHVGATPDGVFGSITAGLVRRFQAEHHLAVDGIVGPMTWKALRST